MPSTRFLLMACALFLSPLAKAHLCPTLLYQAGLATIETGALVSPDFALTSGASSPLYRLPQPDFDFLKHLVRHCRWLRTHSLVPVFAKEHARHCATAQIFSRYYEATLQKRDLSLESAETSGAAAEALQNIITAELDPVLETTKPLLQEKMRSLVPLIRGTLAAWATLSKHERSGVVGATRYLAKWAESNSSAEAPADFAQQAKSDPLLLAEANLLSAFHDLAATHTYTRISVWDLVEVLGEFPKQELAAAKNSFREAFEAANQLYFQAVPAGDSAKESPTAWLVPVATPLESTPTTRVTGAIPSGPRAFTSVPPKYLEMFALRALWLAQRPFGAHREAELQRLQSFPNLAHDFREALHLAQEAHTTRVWLPWSDDPKSPFWRLAEEKNLANALMTDYRLAYFRLMAVIESHQQIEDAALDTLTPRLRDRIVLALDRLDNRHEPLAGRTPFEVETAMRRDQTWWQDARLADALEDYVSALVTHRNTPSTAVPNAEILFSDALTVPRPASDVTVQLMAATGGDHAPELAAELIQVYLRYATTKGWKVAPQSNPMHLKVTGEGAREFFLREAGTHKCHRHNALDERGAKADKIFTSSIQVRVVGSSTTAPNTSQVRVYKKAENAGVLDRRLAPGWNAVTIEEFFTGNGLALLDARARIESEVGVEK